MDIQNILTRLRPSEYWQSKLHTTILFNSHWTGTATVWLPMSLLVINKFSPENLATVWHVKLVSTVLNRSSVRMLVNVEDTGEIVTLEVLLDNLAVPFNHSMSTSKSETEMSTAGSREMAQVRERGDIVPAYSGSDGKVMSTNGVETEKVKIDIA